MVVLNIVVNYTRTGKAMRAVSFNIDAAKLMGGTKGPLSNTLFRDVLARALAVQEVNAAMGVIVAAPTAGGAGVLPAVLTGLAAARGIGDDALVDALATAGLIGAVVAAMWTTPYPIHETVGILEDVHLSPDSFFNPAARSW